MSIANKILGQGYIISSGWTIYTVPDGKQANLNVFLTNTSGSFSRMSAAIIPNGQTLSSKHYIVYNKAILGYGNEKLSGISLSAGDSVWVRGSAGVAMADGIEIT